MGIIAPLLPPPARTGRTRTDDRKVLEAILWVLRSGARWHIVPRELAAPTTVWRRLPATYHGFFPLALALICLNRVLE